MLSLFPTSSTALAFLALVLGFGFIIFIHELGHFLAAKWVGIKVTQFAVGFGQSLLSWRKGIGFRVGSTEAEYDKRLAEHLKSQGRELAKLDSTQQQDVAKSLGLGETEYRLNWIPLGGYVKMLGQEDLNPEAVSADPRSFNAKSVSARALVVSAGVVMNLISAVIFFIIAFSAGVAFPPAIAGPVVPSAPAGSTYAQGHENDPAYRGLQPGDRLIAINGTPMGDFMEVAVTSALSARGQKLNLSVQRPGVEGTLVYPLVATPDTTTNLLSLGIMPPRNTTLELVPKEGPRAQPTLSVPAIAIEANGQPITEYADYHRIVTQAKGQPVDVTFADAKDASKTTTVKVSSSPMLSPSADGKGPANLIGLVPATMVFGTVDNSPAAAAGVRAGDLVAQLGPTAWPNPQSLRDTVVGAAGNGLRLIVLRDGETVDLGTIVPDPSGTIGVYPMPAMDTPIVSTALPDSPADSDMQLPPGSRILAINGQPVANWADMQRLLVEAATAMDTEAGPIEIQYQLNMAGDITGKAMVNLSPTQRKQLLLAQWYPDLDGFGDLRVPLVAGSIWEAASLGVVKTKHYMLQTYVTILRLFQGTVKASHLRGPVGIAHEGTRVAKLGWTYLLFFLGLISVNLAVVNFLPIPVVDGGLMVFLIAEKIKGSPVSVRIQNYATIVGLTLILSLFVVTLFYDLSRLVG